MEIKIFEFNPVAENTYVLFDETKECVIVDAGCFYPYEEKSLLDFIESNDLEVKYLLNTHLHFDHVFGNSFVEKQLNLRPIAHKADEFLLDGMSAQLKMFGFPETPTPPAIAEYIKEGDVIKFGKQTFFVLEVPGHSPGSVAFYNRDCNCVFSGDALFNGSIGRTDLERANHQQLLDSIQRKLFTLPPNTIVYPGHGSSTTVGNELMNNPFFR